MYTKILLPSTMLSVLSLVLISCTMPGDEYAPLTHTASLRNIGKQHVYDASLFFGSGRYKMGIVTPGVAKNISRAGDDIPQYASAEWRRVDGSNHKGTIRIVKPKEMDKRECYIIQIDDDNTLSLSLEIPKPLPKRQPQDATVTGDRHADR